MTKLYDLRTEKCRYAVGIDSKCPRFSWKISSEQANVKQDDFRIRVFCADGVLAWDSNWIRSDAMLIRYDGAALEPYSDYVWELAVHLTDGEQLSEKARFSTGILDSRLFDASSWIALDPICDREAIPAFRKEFSLSEKPLKAKLFTTGCGIYEVYLNGRAVSDRGEKAFPLKPGFTEVLKRKFYHSFDVSDALEENNCLSAIVTRGWWSDRIGKSLGRTQCFRAVLLLQYSDGSHKLISTDESWTASVEHPIRQADVYSGETFDARYSLDFTKFGFDDSAWQKAAVTNAFDGKISSALGEPITVREDLTRKPCRGYTYSEIIDKKNDSYGKVVEKPLKTADSFFLKKGECAVIDFGQNAAGWEHFWVCGKRGCRVTIRHGEILNDRNGEFSRGNDGAGGSLYLANLRKAAATTAYVIGSDDQWEEYCPTFSFYGFRYLSITAEEDVRFRGLEMLILTSVGFDSGRMHSASPEINRLIENGRWGMYSNYLSVPTDCPQRDERMGWTADTQVFATTAMYYSTSAESFLEKWLQDLRDAQGSDGKYPAVAPMGRFIRDFGKMGWADAGILVPYYVYRMTGDSTIIYEHYSSMKLYLDYFLASRGNLGPEPRFGDWLSFEENSDELQEYLGVCFYALDARCMSDMASAIGREDDARYYRSVYHAQKDFFIQTYVTEDGGISLNQQTAALYALWCELLPNEASAEVVLSALKENILGHGIRLQTGFLGTALLLPTLSKFGEHELAYSLLFQDQMPSWLYSVKAGATTIWERWNSYSLDDGFGDAKMNSFNHYAYGCVNEWLFSYAAGICPKDFGFSHFQIAPHPDRRLGSLEAEYDSICGKISSAWRYEGNRVIFSCTVPCNTTAELIHPFTGETKVLNSGNYEFIFEE